MDIMCPENCLLSDYGYCSGLVWLLALVREVSFFSGQWQLQRLVIGQSAQNKGTWNAQPSMVHLSVLPHPRLGDCEKQRRNEGIRSGG